MFGTRISTIACVIPAMNLTVFAVIFGSEFQRLYKMKKQVNLFLLAFLLLAYANVNAQTFEEDMSLGWEERTQKIESLEAHLADWEDRAIGIFIHWSPSTAFQGRYKGQEIEKDLWG